MKRSSTILLQALIVLIGAGVLAAMLWEPHLEGRNINATPFEIYFKDPFLAYAYVASIPFFVGLYQAFKMLGYLGQTGVSSERSVKALRTIRQCGIMLIAFVAMGVFWIMMSDSDDRAGGVFMGIVVAFASLIVTAAATVFERRYSRMV